MYSSYLFIENFAYIEIIENIKDDGISKINIYDVFSSSKKYEESKNTKICKKQLLEYFKGKRKKFNIKLDIEEFGFRRKCLEAIQKIEYAKTISYKDVAIKMGNSKAFRAVGSAISKNPLPIILPCHRVIKSDGNLGGYAFGIEKKRYLLDLEKLNGPI